MRYADQPTTADSPFDLLELDLPPAPAAAVKPEEFRAVLGGIVCDAPASGAPLIFEGAPVTPAEAAAIVMGTEPTAPVPLDEAAVAEVLGARASRCDPTCRGWFVSNDDEPTVQACDSCNRMNESDLAITDEDALLAPGAKDELAEAMRSMLVAVADAAREAAAEARFREVVLPIIGTRDEPVVAAPINPATLPAPLPRGPNGECGCAPQTRPLAENGVCGPCGGWRPLPANFGQIRAPEPARVETRATAQSGGVGGQTEAGRALTALAAGELVAGAAAEGHGVLVSWSGRGEMTRVDLLALLVAADAVDWLPPVRSSHAHAARAVASLGAAYVVRATPVPRITVIGPSGKPTIRTESVEERGWSARWAVGSIAGEGAVGDAYGRISLVVTLLPDGETMVVAGPPEMGAVVQDEYQRLRQTEVMSANDITAWLRSRIHAAGGVRLGGSWYVPTAARPRVERVVSALAATWGTDWMSPPLPVATSDQLRAGLARGLAEEVDDLLAELADARRISRERGAADLGAKAASTFLQRLRGAADRGTAYAATLGEEHVATLRAKARAALAELSPLLNESSARFAMLELS